MLEQLALYAMLMSTINANTVEIISNWCDVDNKTYVLLHTCMYTWVDEICLSMYDTCNIYFNTHDEFNVIGI